MLAEKKIQCPFCSTITNINETIIVTCDACLKKGYPNTRGEFIYVVVGCYGSIAQSWRNNIKTFYDPIKAIEYAKKYEKYAKKVLALFEEFDKKMDTYREIEEKTKKETNIPENLWKFWEKYLTKEEEFNFCIVEPVKVSA